MDKIRESNNVQVDILNAKMQAVNDQHVADVKAINDQHAAEMKTICDKHVAAEKITNDKVTSLTGRIEALETQFNYAELRLFISALHHKDSVQVRTQ